MPRVAVLCLASIAIVAAGCGSSATASPEATATAAATATATVAGEACAPAPEGASADVEVTIVDFDMDPDPVQVTTGQVVGWTNEDVAPHTATLDSQPCDTGMLSTGQSGLIAFNEPGTYTYRCLVHPTQMSGYVVEVTG